MENESTVELDLGSFDFTPDWAKKDAGVVVGKNISGESPKTAARREGREERPRQARPFRDDDRKRRESPARRQGQFPRRDAPPPAILDVKVLPETKALGTIIRKIQQDSHAYKLKDLAYFLLDNPASILLRVTPKDRGALKFHQCKACSFAASSEETLAEHVVAAHLGDYFKPVEIECEPPKGTFSCVARCGLSGVLLGPPNVHEFNSVVKEMIATRYPGMSEADYRAKIEMERDAEAIEEWRKSATKKTVYVESGAADGAQLTREQAEARFRRSVMRQLFSEPKVLMVGAEAALKSPWADLRRAAQTAIDQERRSPAAMCFALRGALHHRKMHFFRANDARGPEFVTGVEYRTFDASHAIPELAKVAKFIAENPCRPQSAIAQDAETAKHLAWLVSTGHVVSFTNGVFSAVEEHPKYGPHWQGKTLAPKEAPAEAAAEEKEEEAVETAKETAMAAEEKEAEEVEAEEAKKEERKEVAPDETAAELAQ